MSLRSSIEAVLPRQPAARSYLACALLLSALYAVINPPFAVNDERDHWLRVVEMTKGRLRSRSDERGAYYQLPQDYYDLISRYGYVQRDGSSRVNLSELAHDLVTGPAQPPHWIRRIANASVYGPVPYLPHLPAVWLTRVLKAPPLWQIYAARCASLLCFTWMTSWAIALAGELGWIFFTLGLMPMTLTQAAGLSGDGMGNALAFVYFALIARGSFGPAPLTRRELWILLGVGALLPACKAPYLLLTLALPALRWDGALPLRRRLAAVAAGVGLAVATLLLWSTLNRSAENAGGEAEGGQLEWLVAHPGEVTSIALQTLATRIDDYTIQFVAARDVVHRQLRFFGGLAAGLYLPLLAAVTLGAARSALRHRPRVRAASLWIALSGIALAAATFGGMYLYASEVGAPLVSGVQGRYFIPLAPALLLPLTTFGSPALGRWLTHRNGRRLKYALVALNGLTLLVLIARYYAAPEADWPY